MALQLNLPKKLEKWPKDWDLHILNTCDFYFDDHESIILVNGRSFPNYISGLWPGEHLQDNTEIRFLFLIGDNYYGSLIQLFLPTKLINVYVFKLIDEVTDLNKIENIAREKNCIEIIQGDHTILLIQSIGSIKCKDAYKAMKEIERIIIEHYKGNGDDDASEPLAPTDPVNSLGLQPISC